MKLFRLFVLVAVVALVAQGLGSVPTAKAQNQVIKIASHSPLSGSQSLLGVAIRNGVDLAIQQLKKPIEDLGFTVEFVPFDDQATQEVGVTNANNIVNDAAILAVVGHLNSGVAIPSSEVYDANDLVMVSPSNTAEAVTDRGFKTVNRICGRDDSQGFIGAKFAADELKVKSVYVLHDKTAYGEGLATSFRQNIETMGVTVLGFEGTEEASNFDAILTPIASQNPELIFYGGIYDKAGPLFKQAREKGITAQFMGGDGLGGSDLVKLGGDAAVDVVFTDVAAPPNLLEEGEKFLEDYKKAFSTDEVENFATNAYASTQVILTAIEAAIKDNGGKMPTRAQVAAAVRATKELPTLLGVVTFDANGDRDIASYYIVKVISADPAKWSSGGREGLSVLTRPSPLTAAAMATMEATMEATP
jgi:branched-chain amino acid transport system substrate-binding protein